MQTPARAELGRVLDGRLVDPVYQPVLDLDRGVVVAYEALARGPAGALSNPAALFSAAAEAGRVVELDWLCRERAVEQARAAGLRHPLSLLVNAEPQTLLASRDEAARWAAFADLRCYAELTERELAARPADLVRCVDQVREQDWGVALDDVGAHPASLALLPLLRPDVIKLDMALLHDLPSSPGDLRVAQVLHGVLAQAAQTGAVIVAEGIETEAHLDLARAYGAHLGQGYLLGRPAPLPDPVVSPPLAVPLLARPFDRAVSPGAFAVVASALPTRRLTRASLHELARQLLAQAARLSPPPVVLACDQAGVLRSPAVDALMETLTDLPLAGSLGAGAPAPSRAWGRTPLAADDPACDDVDLLVVSPHYAAALVGRPALPRSDGQYDAVLTFDAALVSSAANVLLHRL